MAGATASTGTTTTRRSGNMGSGARDDKPPRKSILHNSKKLALIAGLATLSWISTYAGMLELITANMGDLDIVMKVAIGGSVAMLMLMIVWLLDQLFDENNAVPIRAVYALGYLFLTLISVGFSFGFYWKFLESRTEASRSAESAITQVQAALTGAETRLSQLQTSFEGLAAISTQKAADEVATGRSCPNSRPGDGPRRRLREADASQLTIASQFVKDRAAVIRKDIAGLGGDIQKIAKQDPSTFDASGTRNEFMRALSRKLDLTISGYNGFRTDPQLKQMRSDFAERADKSVFPDENGKTFACPDAQLQTGLKGGVKAIDAMPVLVKPEIAIVEGAEATIEAFRRLLVTMTSLATFKMPVSPDDIREQQVKAIQTLGASAPPVVVEQAAGLGKRDWVPLLIAVFVDLCLLLVSIPPALSAAERTRRRRLSATGDGYRTIADLSAIHADEDTLKQLEPLRHIAFDHWGHDYVAVPMIAGKGAIVAEPPRVNAEERGWIMSWFTRQDDDEPEAKLIIGEKDVWEAQFLANLFASHERHGPFKRVFGRFVPVRKKLAAIGSKWQGVQTFRLYRFKKGAWSDFVLDMIVGADRALSPVREAQEAARVAKIEAKSDAIIHEVELKRSEFKSALEEQSDLAKTRRKMREIAAEHEQLKVDFEKGKVELERQKLQGELDRQYAIGAEQFESYIPGQDRDPDGLMVKTKRERTHAPSASSQATPNPELMALMQTVSQQALAAQEMARQQASFMQEMAKSMEILAKARNGMAAEEVRAPAQATAAAGMTLGGVTDFAAYSNREPSLDTGRFREAKPSTEAPVVIPLHGDRTEPRLGADFSGSDRLADRLEAADGNLGQAQGAHQPEFTGQFTGQFAGNAALAMAPKMEATRSRTPLPSLGYGLSRLLGRTQGSSNGSGPQAVPMPPPGSPLGSHGFGSTHDQPIEPMVRDAIDVSSDIGPATQWRGGDQHFAMPEPVAISELRQRGRSVDVSADEPSSPGQIDAFLEAVREPSFDAEGRVEPELAVGETNDDDRDTVFDVGAIISRFGPQTVKGRKRRH